MHRLLFVYGTLKQGHPRCKHLSGQRYLGTARTSQSYSMYKVSNSFPGLVEAFTSHPAQRIYGEMYEVDGDCLDILDDIEGVSEGMYKRMDIMVEDMNLSNLPIFSDTFFKSTETRQNATYIRATCPNSRTVASYGLWIKHGNHHIGNCLFVPAGFFHHVSGNI